MTISCPQHIWLKCSSFYDDISSPWWWSMHPVQMGAANFHSLIVTVVGRCYIYTNASCCHQDYFYLKISWFLCHSSPLSRMCKMTHLFHHFTSTLAKDPHSHVSPCHLVEHYYRSVGTVHVKKWFTCMYLQSFLQKLMLTTHEFSWDGGKQHLLSFVIYCTCLQRGCFPPSKAWV